MLEKKVYFAPEAWEQLVWMCRKADTEIGFFGVADDPDDLFYITRLMMPLQTCTAATVEFDDDSLNEQACKLYDEGLEPRQVLRHWIHTHPGNSATPSGTDWTTLTARFSDVDWCTMLILAKGGDFTGHLYEKPPWFKEHTVSPIQKDIVQYEPDESWQQLLDDRVVEERSYTLGSYKNYGSYNWSGKSAKQSGLAKPIVANDDIWAEEGLDEIHSWNDSFIEETDITQEEQELLAQERLRNANDDLPF